MHPHHWIFDVFLPIELVNQGYYFWIGHRFESDELFDWSVDIKFEHDEIFGAAILLDDSEHIERISILFGNPVRVVVQER